MTKISRPPEEISILAGPYGIFSAAIKVSEADISSKKYR
jgi:hypothetical protein